MDASDTATPTVSVIIPYYEQQFDLDRLMQTLSRRPPGRLVEIVIVDDGSAAPPTVPDEVARSGIDVTVIRQPDLGFRAAAARNLGARTSSGTVLVFLDCDMCPIDDAVDVLAQRAGESPNCMTVGRRIHVDLDGIAGTALAEILDAGSYRTDLVQFDDPQWLADLYRRTHDLSRPDERSYQGVISACMSISRRLFDELGGFDETIVGYGGEDWDLAYRAYTAGVEFAHEPMARFLHNGPDWAGRTSGPKNTEHLHLVDRIPGERDPLRGRLSQILITANVSGWSHDQVVHFACETLTRFPHNAALTVIDADPRAWSVLRHDSRICDARFDEDIVGRSLYQLTVNRRISPADMASIVDGLTVDDFGRVTAWIDDGIAVDAVATRALNRARRLSDTDVQVDDLIDRVFGWRKVWVDSVLPSVDLARSLPR